MPASVDKKYPPLLIVGINRGGQIGRPLPIGFPKRLLNFFVVVHLNPCVLEWIRWNIV